MTEKFPIESWLFDLCGSVFELLLKCWLVAFFLLLLGAVILILLCCCEEMRKNRPPRMGIKPEADSEHVPTPLCKRPSDCSRIGRRPRRILSQALKFRSGLNRARFLLCVFPGLLAGSLKSPDAYCSEPTEHRVPLGLDEFIPINGSSR